jgi:hypothetical protein
MREGQPRTALQLLTKLKDNVAITGGDAILPLLLHLYNRTKNSLNFDDLNSLKLHRSHVNVWRLSWDQLAFASAKKMLGTEK